jgi:hypothetical protein
MSEPFLLGLFRFFLYFYQVVLARTQADSFGVVQAGLPVCFGEDVLEVVVVEVGAFG